MDVKKVWTGKSSRQVRMGGCEYFLKISKHGSKMRISPFFLRGASNLCPFMISTEQVSPEHLVPLDQQKWVVPKCQEAAIFSWQPWYLWWSRGKCDKKISSVFRVMVSGIVQLLCLCWQHFPLVTRIKRWRWRWRTFPVQHVWWIPRRAAVGTCLYRWRILRWHCRHRCQGWWCCSST